MGDSGGGTSSVWGWVCFTVFVALFWKWILIALFCVLAGVAIWYVGQYFIEQAELEKRRKEQLHASEDELLHTDPDEWRR